jgi:predicted P-loop ATPase
MPAPYVLLGQVLSLGHKFGDRDTVRRVTKNIIVEVAELDQTFSQADVAALKNFLTTPIDSYRDVYQRGISARARCTTYVATVNPVGFLRDVTGERRFWPLAVTRCNAYHGIDLQQLWAQVMYIHNKGEQYWLTEDEAKQHAEIVEQHKEISDERDVVLAMNSLAKIFTDKSAWLVATSKELLQYYEKSYAPINSYKLNRALEAAGYETGSRHDHIRGHLVPPFRQPLTTAQQRGFSIIRGGLEPDTGDKI